MLVLNAHLALRGFEGIEREREGEGETETAKCILDIHLMLVLDGRLVLPRRIASTLDITYHHILHT